MLLSPKKRMNFVTLFGITITVITLLFTFHNQSANKQKRPRYQTQTGLRRKAHISFTRLLICGLIMCFLMATAAFFDHLWLLEYLEKRVYALFPLSPAAFPILESMIFGMWLVWVIFCCLTMGYSLLQKSQRAFD